MLELAIIPNDSYLKLLGKVWGHIGLPDDQLPLWVQNIPDWAEEQVLATGPAFEPGQQHGKMINSEKLFSDVSYLKHFESRLLQEKNKWFVIISDPDLENAILLDEPFELHEAWVRALSQSGEQVLIYAIAKHPDQTHLELESL